MCQKEKKNYIVALRHYIQTLKNSKVHKSVKRQEISLKNLKGVISKIEKMIVNSELSENEMAMFYDESMKIGLPVIDNRETDILLE